MKAVSPIISVLLLIAIAVILVGMFFLFTTVWQQSQQEQIESGVISPACSNAGIVIKECKFYDSSDRLVLKVENAGTIDLNKFTVTAISQYDTMRGTFTKTIKAGSIEIIDSDNFTYFSVDSGSLTGLDVTSVKITPVECPIQSDIKSCSKA